MKFVKFAFIFIALVGVGCNATDEASCEMNCGDNIDGGEFDIDVNSNFALVYPGGEEVIYKNESGDTLTFSNGSLQEEPTQISYLNCFNSCSSSSTSFSSNIKTLTRRSGDLELTLTVKVGIIGETIGVDPFFFDYVDVFSEQAPMRVFLKDRGNTQVDQSKVNIITSFNQQLLLGTRTFDDVYSLVQDAGEIHYNFFHGVVAFRNGISNPLWVFDRVE